MLVQAWGDFCERLKSLGPLILKPSVPSTPLDRAEGIRYLSRLLSLGLDLVLENGDADWPWMQQALSPIRKMGGDNPDALYLGAPVSGRHAYRVHGTRGTVSYLGFTVLGGLVGATGQRRIIANLSGKDLQTAADGSFEVFLGGEPRPGNWMKLEPDATRLAVRQFFLDWETETPAVLHIERLGEVGAPPPLAPQRLAQTLPGVAMFVAGAAALWAGQLDQLTAAPNELRRLENAAELQASPDVVYYPGYFRLGEEEALLISFRPPSAPYWNMQIGNYWYESMDYRYHPASLNAAQAAVDADGIVRIVVAHRDPGIQNWLDTAGHREGHMFVRWLLADESPVPACRVVPWAELSALLPPSTRRCSPAERAEVLRRRRLAVERRFGN
jgi:hypothetical protein